MSRHPCRRAPYGGEKPAAASLRPLIVLAALLFPAALRAEPAAAAPSVSRTRPARAEDDFLGRLTFTSDRGPVTISAKELEFDYQTRTLTYRGSVRVSQGDLTLDSDSLTVSLDGEGPDTVREVLAEGKVRIVQGQRVATGGRAIFDQNRRTVVLSDTAVLREGPNEVAGERVVVYLDEKRSVVEGGEQRVRAVFFPPNEDETKKAAEP